MGTNCGKHLCKGKHDCGSCNETKHGKWVIQNWRGELAQYGCNLCGQVMEMYGDKPTNYCPNCGAKMDLEE